MPSNKTDCSRHFRLATSDLMAPHLGLRKHLERSNRRIAAVYFPEEGFASVVAIPSNSKQVEVGLIGREGMTGLPSARQSALASCDLYSSARKGQVHTNDGIAQGDPGQPAASRLVVEVRAGIRRANNPHRNLQRAVQLGRAIGPMAVDSARPS
jgi:hypothetical protein